MACSDAVSQCYPDRTYRFFNSILQAIVKANKAVKPIMNECLARLASIESKIHFQERLLKNNFKNNAFITMASTRLAVGDEGDNVIPS